MRNSSLRTLLLLSMTISSFARAAVSVSPLTVEVRRTAPVVPFEIQISALGDSDVEVEVVEISQGSDGKIQFKKVSEGNDKIVSLEMGAEKKNLKKGDAWTLKGSYAFNKLKKGRAVELAVVIIDKAKKDNKNSFQINRNYRYAVTLKTDNMDANSRPSLALNFSGLRREGSLLILAADVKNNSNVMIDVEAEATLRDEKTKKVVETVRMRFDSDLDKKKPFRIYPGNKVNISGVVNNINLRGRFLSTVKLVGKSAKYSKSSGISVVDFEENLFKELKPEVSKKIVGIEFDAKKIDHQGLITVKNPNFFPVALKANISETPTPAAGNISLEKESLEIKPGETVTLKVKASDVRLSKGISSHDGKWLLRLSYFKQGGDLLGEDDLPVSFLLPIEAAEFFKGIEDSEKDVKGE